MISQGNAAWNMTEKIQFVSNATLENHEKLNNQTVLNLEMCLKQYGNFWNTHDTELIAGLSDQQRWLFCWTDAVFGGLGHRSTRLFRRLI